MSKIIIYHPFNKDNSKLIAYLKQIQTILLSSCGPYGKLKLITQSQNKNIYLAGSSKYLKDSLYNFKYIKNESSNEDEYIKWLFDLISQAIQLHIDNNYDSGLLTIYLLNEFYLLNTTNTNYQYFIEISFNELFRHLSHPDECKLKLKLDLSNLDHLRNLLKTILNTKYFYRANTNNDEKFLNLFLKANLNSFNNEMPIYFSIINYLFNTTNFKLNLNDSKLFNGILISVDNLNNLNLIENLINFKFRVKNKLKCVLFDTQLSADFEQFNFENIKFEIEVNKSKSVDNRNVFLFIEKLKSLCDILLENQVDVVLCQKVIHPSIKSYLFEKKCIPIDRLSIVYTNALVQLTSCKICKSAFNPEQFNDSSIYGSLTSLSIKRINDISKVYLNFENDAKYLQTMIVCLPDEIYSDEIQNLLKVAELSFQRAIFNGFVLTGGPCFYSYSICYLWKFLFKTSDNKALLYNFMTKLKSVFVNYSRNLLKYSNSLHDYFINTRNGHLFYIKSKYCECGMLANVEIQDGKLELYDDENISFLNFDLFLNGEAGHNSIKTPNLIDCYESKLNSLRLVKNLLSTIFQIGVFISDTNE